MKVVGRTWFFCVVLQTYQVSSFVPQCSWTHSFASNSKSTCRKYLYKQFMSTADEVSAPSDVEGEVNSPLSSSSAATIDEESKNGLLAKLLLSSSSTDRGQLASEDEKAKIQAIIQKMETLNDGEDQPATKDELMTGTWELIYSDTQLFRSSPFFMAGRAVCKTTEEAERYDWFCDMHRAALAISTIGKVRQIVVQNSKLVSEFEVKVGSIPFLNDYTPFSYSGGLPGTINGAIVSTADISPTSNGKGWEIYMDTVEIKGSNIPLLRRVLDMPEVKLESRSLAGVLENTIPEYETPRPVFVTTYLDETLRISRDQDGKVFVYTKVSNSDEPKDYKGVDADLGIGKLLEGLNDNFFKFYI